MPPHPSRPHTYPRRVLLCGAGLSPPVITETLYALTEQRRKVPAATALTRSPSPFESLLAAGGSNAAVPVTVEPFVPTEIHVLTTQRGRDEIVRNLLGPGGWFTRFLADYPQPNPIRFGVDDIHVIAHAGREVSDIETEADSLAAGMTIVSVVKELVRDDDCAIHTSIAGGRRQMSYLLGMTMSLLGRGQDRLSHVLVNAMFETKGFFYPTPYPHLVQTRNHGERDAGEAEVVLAEMPLLRLIDGMAASLNDGKQSFADLVVMGQRAIERPPIVVDTAERLLKVGPAECRLSPQEMFFYAVLALRRRELCLEFGVSINKPGAVVVTKQFAIGLDGPLARIVADQIPEGVFNPADNPKAMRELISKLNKKLVTVFGLAVAERMLIVGPKRSHDGHYGLLNAQPGDLRARIFTESSRRVR